MAAAGLAVVTGASGFVGSHLVDALLASGRRVRCLVRPTSRLDRLPADRVELVTGTFDEPRALDDACRDADLVIHAAGAIGAGDEAAYLRANADATRALVEAARRVAPGLRRFVLVSSLAAAGPTGRGRPRREEEPEAPAGPYGRSKLAGERALREGAGDLPWTIVRPAAVYGPRDDAFLKLFRMVRRGVFVRPSGPRQEISLVHVADLAAAILAAAGTDATIARDYFVAHPVPRTWDEVAAAAGRALGRRVRVLPVPRGVIPVVARIAGAWASMRGRANPLPPDRLADLLAPAWTCTVERARRDFGFAPRYDLDPGMAATLPWYVDAGLLR